MSWSDTIRLAVYRRVPALENNFDLCNDLIEDAFRSIMTYSKADSYKKEWDSVLVRCVAMLYNNIGTEGSISRSSIDVSDSYDLTDILASFIVANIPQYIKPVGYKYKEDRFKFPD